MRYWYVKVLCGAALLSSLGVAEATTFSVTKTADTNDGICDTDCSLREAIIAANTLVGADVISLPTGNYQLTLAGRNEDFGATGDLDVSDDLVINGAGSDQSFIDGNELDRVIQVSEGINVSINNLAIVNGVSLFSNSGAGLYNQGNTTVTNVHFEGNITDSNGGAIESRSATSNLTIDSSSFTNNCSFSGGALDSVGGLTIVNSVFNGNVPMLKAGIDCPNGDGAAIHVQDGSNATIDNSTFINNIGHVGAISGYFGTLTILNTTIVNNQGLGGLYSQGAGGIENQGYVSSIPGWGLIVTVENSTIANNVANQTGGGVFGRVDLVNTIVANNSAPVGSDCSGFAGLNEPVSNGNNIIGNVAGCGIVLQPTDFVGDPQLEVLATDNATGQSYLSLAATSPAIDAANNALCPATDQIGTVRPVDGDGNGSSDCDIGAYEYMVLVQADVCPVGCAFSTIQTAVDAAASRSTVTVGPGVYSESVVINKQLTLQSVTGATNTIVDATGLGQSVFTISQSTTIDGFTIMGGQAGWGAGLGVSSGGLTLRNSIVKDNVASAYGGGILGNTYVSLTIEDNIFESNTATWGGGAISWSSYGDKVIQRNVFRNNSAKDGGAISAGSYGGGMIKNNLFSNNHNTLYFGPYANSKVVNNSIVGSTGYGVGKATYGRIDMLNSIVWNNEVNLHGWGWYWSVQNSLVDVDPLFVDEANGDYHLQAGSPAIDTGLDASTLTFAVIADFDSVARPQDGDGQGAGGTGDGTDYDIGAYEFVP